MTSNSVDPTAGSNTTVNADRKTTSTAPSETDNAAVADRYAIALFDLAEANKSLDETAEELKQLDVLIRETPDLTSLVRSPVISRDNQGRAMDAILAAAGASDLTRRFVGVVAANRRLYMLRAIIAAYLKRLADFRGEVLAEVRSAQPLSPQQWAAVTQAIKQSVGANVTLTTRVEPDLLGGLVVKVGSRMVDTSLKTKLHRLSLAIKGVG